MLKQREKKKVTFLSAEMGLNSIMAYREEEINFIKKQIKSLKASNTYQGKKITNEVIAEIANVSVSSAINWSAGKKLMRETHREEITKKLELDPHYFDLEYSKECRMKRKSEEELNYFLSSTVGVLDIIGLLPSNEALQSLNQTYSLLKSFGFDKVVKKFEARGDTASIASLIHEWNNAFYVFYLTLEPLLEDYCSDVNKITDPTRKEVEIENKVVKTPVQFNDKLINQLSELGEKYSFFLAGTFDALGNIDFELYKAEKYPAPEEQDKGE